MSDTNWVMRTRIVGIPAPQGSKRHVGGGRMIESSKALAPWRTLVAWTIAQEWPNAPLDGPVYVRLGFVMPRPKSTPKRFTPPAIKKPDVDKLERAILDALTGVVWRDDSQVVDLHGRKRLAELDETPGVDLWVGVLTDPALISPVGPPGPSSAVITHGEPVRPVAGK